ncbi:MAG: hypothetical protein QXE92_02565 [Thermofilaceae archaeon]
MTTIFIDNHVKRLLDEVKKELARKGYSGVTYNDAIRYLYFLATGRMDVEEPAGQTGKERKLNNPKEEKET